MDGPKSGSRSLAQAEVLRALARVFPDPLIELAQIARTSLTGAPLNDQLDAWAAKWQLKELREVAEAHVYYWAGTTDAAAPLFLTPPATLPAIHLGPRPATAITGAWSPPVIWLPLEQLDPSDPLDPPVWFPDHESRGAFLARVEAHCDKQEEASSGHTPAHRKPMLALHAEWYVLRVVARPRPKLRMLAGNGDISTVTKAIGRFRKLLRAGL